MASKKKMGWANSPWINADAVPTSQGPLRVRLVSILSFGDGFFVNESADPDKTMKIVLLVHASWSNEHQDHRVASNRVRVEFGGMVIHEFHIPMHGLERSCTKKEAYLRVLQKDALSWVSSWLNSVRGTLTVLEEKRAKNVDGAKGSG